MEDDAATAMRAALEARDATDPLGAFRDEFLLREGLIYLDGNSLGPLHRSVPARLDACQRKEWGDDLIASWNTADWVSLPLSVGARIAPLIGAEEGTVAVADSTSVNLFKVLAATLAARPDRRAENFLPLPTRRPRSDSGRVMDRLGEGPQLVRDPVGCDQWREVSDAGDLAEVPHGDMANQVLGRLAPQ